MQVAIPFKSIDFFVSKLKQWKRSLKCKLHLFELSREFEKMPFLSKCAHFPLLLSDDMNNTKNKDDAYFVIMDYIFYQKQLMHKWQ